MHGLGLVGSNLSEIGGVEVPIPKPAKLCRKILSASFHCRSKDIISRILDIILQIPTVKI